MNGSRSVLLSIALVGILTGVFVDRLSSPRLPRMLNACASSKQYVVEFRLNDGNMFEKTPGLKNERLNETDVTVEVDGERIGKLEVMGPPLRRFLCEGNHEARISYLEFFGQRRTEVHRVEFAVSRPSLFHVTQWMQHEDEVATCVSRSCSQRNVGFELSAMEPDDLKARVYPPEPRD